MFTSYQIQSRKVPPKSGGMTLRRIKSHKNRGITLVLTVLILPAIFLIGALVIDGGRYYIHQQQLDYITRASGEASLVTINQKFIAQAETNYQNTCNVSFPPSKCSNPQTDNFLSHSEKQSIINDSQTQTDITTTLDQLWQDPLWDSVVTRSDIEFEFPYHTVSSNTEVQIRIKATATPKLSFIGLLGPTGSITQYHISGLSL